MNESEAGYAIEPQVFDEAEVRHTVDALERTVIGRTKAGARHILTVPAVRALAEDSRLTCIAARFVGATAVAFRATLFDKSAAANWLVVWHQDTALPVRQRIADACWGPWTMKSGAWYAHAPAWALDKIVALRVHLDDSTATNGPLRVLPGTHVHGVLSDTDIARLTREIDAVECIAPSGSIVAMRPLTVHASSKTRDNHRRRVLHLEYAADMHLGDGIELAVG